MELFGLNELFGERGVAKLDEIADHHQPVSARDTELYIMVGHRFVKYPNRKFDPENTNATKIRAIPEILDVNSVDSLIKHIQGQGKKAAVVCTSPDDVRIFGEIPSGVTNWSISMSYGGGFNLPIVNYNP